MTEKNDEEFLQTLSNENKHIFNKSLSTGKLTEDLKDFC